MTALTIILSAKARLSHSDDGRSFITITAVGAVSSSGWENARLENFQINNGVLSCELHADKPQASHVLCIESMVTATSVYEIFDDIHHVKVNGIAPEGARQKSNSKEVAVYELVDKIESIICSSIQDETSTEKIRIIATGQILGEHWQNPKLSPVKSHRYGGNATFANLEDQDDFLQYEFIVERPTRIISEKSQNITVSIDVDVTGIEQRKLCVIGQKNRKSKDIKQTEPELESTSRSWCILT